MDGFERHEGEIVETTVDKLMEFGDIRATEGGLVVLDFIGNFVNNHIGKLSAFTDNDQARGAVKMLNTLENLIAATSEYYKNPDQFEQILAGAIARRQAAA